MLGVYSFPSISQNSRICTFPMGGDVILSKLKYLEMNGSTSIGKLMDAPLLFFSLFASAFLELMCIAPIFRGITNTELIISFFFLVIYVGMILLSSKLKAKYMKKGVKSFSNEGKKKLSMVAS